MGCELNAGLGVIQGSLKSRPGEPYAAGSDIDPAFIQVSMAILNPVPSSPSRFSHGDTDVIQMISATFKDLCPILSSTLPMEAPGFRGDE